MTPATLVEGNLVRNVAHPEWGIGTIEQIEGTSAQVRFYQGGEQVHACLLTVLHRHAYAIHDQIFAITENTYGIVISMREIEGLITYQAQFGQRRKGIPETNILPQSMALEPFDLVSDASQIDTRAFTLALQARRLLYAYRYDELVSLSSARIELLPHQVFVADRVIRDYPHRFLLADEVGLGKTIEAGLILKELRARGSAKRVLIVVPAGLVSQWVDELNKKFNDAFTRIDSTNIAAHVSLCGGRVEQVWQTYPSIVTSLHMLRTNEVYIEALADQEWDLIIFDEAHHLRRHLERRRSGARGDQDERRVTAAYRMAQRLQQRTTSLLLLTATPLQLHTFELYSLIELLDPALFADFADFERYRTQVPRLNRIARQIDRYIELGEPERQALASSLSDLLREHGRGDASRVPVLLAQLENAELRSGLQDQVADLHRLTRVLLRNRKREVFDDLQPRSARILRVEFSPPEHAAYHAVSEYLQHWYNLALEQNDQALGFLMVTYRKILTSSSYALGQSFRKRIARLSQIRRGGRLRQRIEQGAIDPDEMEELDDLVERYGDSVISADPALIDIEIEQLNGLCAMLGQINVDTKAHQLLNALASLLSDPREKVLIFTQFKETLFYLKILLEPTYRVTVFYGRMEAAEKDQAVDDFRESKQIMIATEAAGEGRNLQFCHVMFNYDLPWNPMKIEQRIGRLDRIGQRSPVQIFNFSIAGTIEERVLQVLHERINIFESTIGALDPILESIEDDVRIVVFGTSGDTEQRFQHFEQRIAEREYEIHQMEERLSDFLLDRSSFRRDRADALLGRTPVFTGADIQRFLTQFLEHLGAQMRERSSGIYDFSIPRHMQVSAGSNLRDNYHVTFDAAQAQQQERLDFVAFGHPVLDRAVEICLDEQFGGRIAHLVLATDEVPAQPVIVAIYEFTCEGIRPRREVRAFATALDGTHLPALSVRLLTLAAQMEPASLDADQRHRFNSAMELCRETIRFQAAQELEQERQRQDVQNRREYELAHRKLTHFYAAQHLSLDREIQRIERLLADQQQSSEPNVRRIIPATQGRLSAAQRQRDELDAERDRLLSNLGKQRTVVAAEELLGVAYLLIEPIADKDSNHAS